MEAEGAAPRTAGRRLHRARFAAAILALVVAPLSLAESASAAPPLGGLASTGAGGDHTCGVTTTGTVECWGFNDAGQLGDTTAVPRLTPHVVPLLSGIAVVSSGESHTCALSTAGGLQCWGLNDHGEIGNGGSAQPGHGILVPTDVLGATSGVAQIDLGNEFSCLVTTPGGTAKCWGRNDSGQLGIGTTLSRFQPANVVGLLSGVAKIAAGGKHTCALTTTATVKCWGLNAHGQIGDGSLVLRKSPVDVPGLTNVTALALGGQHTCALISGGTVQCWGANSAGQLGDGNTTDASSPTPVIGLPAGITAIAAGGGYTCAISSANALYCWGSNANGQLGDGTTISNATPVAVPGAAANIAAISAGRLHSCVTLTSGATKCWGANPNGELGDGTKVDLYGPFFPDAPTGAAAAAGDQSATVSWTLPADDGGFPITSYVVHTFPGGAALTLPSAPLSTPITGLTNGVAYTFTVTAVTQVGPSRPSAASAPVTPAGPPGAPTALGVTTADSQATVSWQPAPSNGAALTAYRLTASPGGRTTIVSGSRSSATLIGLTNGTTYKFSVRATNKVGTGSSASVTKKLPIPKSGYWMLGANGSVYPFGNSQQLGSASYPGWAGGAAAVAMAVRKDGLGYWIVDNVGAVHAFGGARNYGDHPHVRSGEHVSTISATPTGKGYWLFTSQGRAIRYGDAKFFGDMGAVHLNGPVVASTATPTGHGYFMVASDGGVFTFGDAHFHGSTGAIKLNKPVVGLSPTVTNGGYWLVASDGGVFAFGDAKFRGSMGGVKLNQAVNGLVRFGSGYLMVASDGGVFDFSDKPFFGSLAAHPPAAPIIGIAAFTF